MITLKKFVGLIVIVAAVLTIFGGDTAFATDQSPENTQWRYFVSNSTNSTANKIKKMQLSIYYPADATGNKTITMHMKASGDVCSANIYGDQSETGVKPNYTIRIIQPTGVPAVTGKCAKDATKSITVNVTNAPIDSLTGLREVIWEVENTTSAAISAMVFYVTAPDNKHIGIAGGQTVGLNTAGVCSGNASDRNCALVDNAINFGTCAVPSVDKQFTFYDLNDSYQYGDNTSNKNFYIHIKKAGTKLGKSNYAQSGFTWVSDSDARWRPTTLPDEMATISLGVKAASLSPGVKYTLDIDNVSEANSYSLKFPSDVHEVFGTITCSNWTITPTTDIAGTAKIGETVTWTHYAQQNGPTATDAASNFSLTHAGSTSTSWAGTVVGSTNFANGRAKDASRVSVRTETKTFGASDVGNTYCSAITASRGSSQNGNSVTSSSKCVTVTSNWTSTASTAIDRTVATVGDSVTWTHTVNNAGPDKTSKTVAYGYNHSNGWTGATQIGTRAAEQASGQIATYTETRAITRDDIGKTLCSQAYISPTSHTNNATVYATTRCVTIPDWTITGMTYSAVNHASPTSNTTDTSSNALYNNNRKTAYPSYPAFGGHAAGAEDKIYYMVKVTRGGDTNPGAATFKYRPAWLFGSGMITANTVNGGQTDVSSLCPTGFAYSSSYKRCAKDGS